MEENFSFFRSRILSTLAYTDCKQLFENLDHIRGNTLFVGAGGSKVVSLFACLVLEKKNHLLGVTCSYRDLLYMPLEEYQNLFVASYSGMNYGVTVAQKIPLKKYLFSSKKEENTFDSLLSYGSFLPKEKSFISLGATLVPMTLLLLYYNPSFFPIFPSIEEKYLTRAYSSFEVYTGLDTSVAATYLESTIVEAGLGTIVLHDKYDYCHGRSTYSKVQKPLIIYLINQEKELDRVLLSLFQSKKRNIVILKGESSDFLFNQYQLLVKSMYLTKEIASYLKKDLSEVSYDKTIVPKVYHFEGEM